MPHWRTQRQGARQGPQNRPQRSHPPVQGRSSQTASGYPQPNPQHNSAISKSSAPADAVSKPPELSITAASSPLPSAQPLPAATLAPQNSRPLTPAQPPALSQPPPTARSTAHSPPKALEQHPGPASGHHQGPQEEQPRQFRHEAASRFRPKSAAGSPQPAGATLGNQAPPHTDPVAGHTTQIPPAESQTEQQPARSQAVAATAHPPRDQGMDSPPTSGSGVVGDLAAARPRHGSPQPDEMRGLFTNWSPLSAVAASQQPRSQPGTEQRIFSPRRLRLINQPPQADLLIAFSSDGKSSLTVLTLIYFCLCIYLCSLITYLFRTLLGARKSWNSKWHQWYCVQEKLRNYQLQRNAELLWPIAATVRDVPRRFANKLSITDNAVALHDLHFIWYYIMNFLSRLHLGLQAVFSLQYV